MPTHARSLRRRFRQVLLPILLTALVALLAVPVTASTAATVPRPVPLAGPANGRSAAATASAPDAAAEGDCELSGVTCRPNHSGSCTGYTSQTTPPATIKVGVRTSSTALTIKSVAFETYVENVLPNEWIGSWDGDSLKAGAIAVKSYAWYWVIHYGGTANGACFDVTDDADFQVYQANTAQTRTTTAVTSTWPVAARVNGKILQTFYRNYFTSSSEACGAKANGTTMSQWGTQNCVEANTGNKYNVILAKYYYPGLQLATTRQQRTPDDFTYTQTSTRATYAAGHWALDDGYGTTFTYGEAGDIPTITDSGDGFAHLGVWRPSNGTWYQAGTTGTTLTTTRWGESGDVPLAAHYLGLTKPSVLAVWRPSDGTWYIRGIATIHYGEKGDIPVPADYTGDGTTDIALWRPSNGTWYRRGATSIAYGNKGDVPVTGDFTGDGKADLVLYRPGNHTWYTRGQAPVVLGGSGVTPIGKAPLSR